VAVPPVLRVGGALADALAPDALAALAGEPLGAYLAGRRWYGAKGKGIRGARFAAVIPVAAPGLVAVLTCVEVELPCGQRERYQLPLGVLDAGPGAGEGGPDVAVLARVEAGGARGLLVDATGDPAFRDWLHDAFTHGATIRGDEVRLVVEPVPARGADASPAPRVPRLASRLVSSEQSNSSIVFGDRVILKLFRRLEPGESPDVEMARFLATRTSFRHTPALRAAARYEGAVEGAAGMLQAFVPNATDAFSYALEAARHAAPDAARAGFVADAARLGAVTRELHEALATDAPDPDFAPRPAGAAEVARWVAGVQRTAAAGFDILERRGRPEAIGERGAALVRGLAGRRDAVVGRLARVAGEVGDDGGQLVRHHGDYHLGQVLRTIEGDLLVIDFEGEPARPLAERRARHSALRDVAGMLRSFGYAAAMGAAHPAAGEDRAPAAAAARSSRWERDVRHAFLHGYFGGEDAAPGAAFLPRTREHADALVALFEVEKAFYEVAYELNNRPGWTWMPLEGIARLTERWETDR
jgi:maltose alpha-D-glucosyltransferase/alpha-amylase